MFKKPPTNDKPFTDPGPARENVVNIKQKVQHYVCTANLIGVDKSGITDSDKIELPPEQNVCADSISFMVTGNGSLTSAYKQAREKAEAVFGAVFKNPVVQVNLQEMLQKG